MTVFGTIIISKDIVCLIGGLDTILRLLLMMHHLYRSIPMKPIIGLRYYQKQRMSLNKIQITK
jgi:hypothetical protein